MALDRFASRAIAAELIRVLGKPRTMELLAVKETRMSHLSNGSASLKSAELKCITTQTGRSWMRWGVDGISRTSRTAERRKLDAATYEMLDKIDPVPNGAAKISRRSKSELTVPSRVRQRRAS
jgi:hypothetical protein